MEANPPQVRKTDTTVGDKNSQDTSSTLTDVINIKGSPSFTGSMIDKARKTKERSNERAY